MPNFGRWEVFIEQAKENVGSDDWDDVIAEAKRLASVAGAWVERMIGSATPEKKSKVMAQLIYCRDKHVPFFAPLNRCSSCGRDVWDRVSLEAAGRELITGCPFCNRSYCD